MSLKLPTSIEELYQRNISTECPYCGDTVKLLPQHSPTNHMFSSYFVALCPNYKRTKCEPIVAVYDTLNDYIFKKYPIPTFDASRMHDSIPYELRQDYAEAIRCNYVDAYKGAVTLLRRVIEAISCDKLGSEAKDKNGRTKRLSTLIDLMQKEGLITKDIAEGAHEIRLFGNYGAHVQDDGLDSVERDEAIDVREITWQILYAVYVAPYKTKELALKRKKKTEPE